MWPLPPSMVSPAWRRLSSFLPLNLDSSKAGDPASGLISVLKTAMNGEFVLENKPAWFILHSEDGI